MAVIRGEAINILHLYGTANNEIWNNWLAKCIKSDNVNDLLAKRRGLQMGMDNLVKRKQNSDEINIFFTRLITSIDKTIRVVYKRKFPNPLDIPGNDKNFSEDQVKKFKEHKQERDKRIELITRNKSF